MRNLKKFLALVLAMVMAFSLMLTASAADKYDDFKDTEEVTDEFVEAVKVLSGLEVIKGDGEEDNKKIRPGEPITRAEAAALVYRLVTGDVTDRQVRMYSDYGKFTDVKSDDWFAGYVGYCQNANIIKGTTPTTFNPYGQVTGYEVLAMILRAVGYGKNGEFTGSSWQVNVASLGKTKHITDSVASAHFNYTLNMPATREIVAELLFRGTLIPKVEWTALGYSEFKNAISSNGYNGNLASEVFGLYFEGWQVIDNWGNPGYVWKASRNPSKLRTVATIKAVPDYEFHETKHECDIAEALDFSSEMTATLFVNGKTAITDKYKIVATDTVTKVGGEGRLVKIYTIDSLKEQSHYYLWTQYWDQGKYWEDGGAERNVVTMMDTMLAKVISTTEAVLDPAGHVITPAKLTVDVYGTNHDYNTPERRTIANSGASNWEYSRGDVILMNAYTNHSARSAQIDKEKAAFETDNVAATLEKGKNVFIIDPPTSITGKQTLVYWNQDKHQVAGDDKTDALTLDLDAAGTNINTTYTWYFDKYDNLIGIDEVKNLRYGVITSVYASFGQGESSTNGTAKAIASVQYADGTTGTEEIDYFMVTGTGVGTRGTITTAMKDGTVNGVTAAQEVQLWPVYDISTYKPMKEDDLSTAMPNVTLSPTLGVDQGVVNMAPTASLNTLGAKDASDNNLHGILKNNLFKFVKSTNDQTVAIEVAGGGTTYTGLSTNGVGKYDGHWAAETDGTNAGKLYKNLAYLDLNTGAATTVAAWVDNETQIIFRDKDTGKISTYNGVSALPGDIVVPDDDFSGDDACLANEIDWADTDGDGRAEVMYITGSIDGLITYGLFYFNGGASSWDGTKGIANGWLNGDAATLTFTDLDQLNLIRNAKTADGRAYDAHLFAVKQFNGVVTDVMGVSGTSTTANLLMDHYASGALYTTPGNNPAGRYNKDGQKITAFETNILLTAGTGAADFKNGGKAGQERFGNPYTDNTEAVYYKDSSAVDATLTNISFVPDALGGRVVVSGANTGTYHTNPNTKIYGIGSGVTEGIAALAYLNEYDENDVTIIYENSGATDHAILEIYVAIDPDITPSDRPGVSTGATQAVGVGTDVSSFAAAAFANPAAWQTFLRVRPNSGAYYWNESTGAANNPFSASAKNSETLVVPFVNPTGAAGLTISYTVKDSDGDVVYTENGTTVATGTTVGTDAINGVHVFTLDFSSNSDGTANNAPGVWWNGTKGLNAGTYTLEIQVALQTVYTCTFTLI